VHVALGQALIIYIYALPYRANNSAVMTVGKPNGDDPPAHVGETYETVRVIHAVRMRTERYSVTLTY
jgi:hypothetical protein